MRIEDYAKLEETKSLILSHLSSLGMKEHVKIMNDKDLKDIMILMNRLGTQLNSKKDDQDKMEFLISYIIALWVNLVVEHGVDQETL